jgi:type IV secretory pathway TraG/TraD family ATPase VirD4
VGSPHVAGLPQAQSRQLPPSGAIPREGLIVARSNFPGAERPLAISPADACKHLHLIGPTGVGKSAVMGNLAAQAMRAGNGVIVMERKGDLFKAVLDAVPRERLDDVILVDVGDDTPVGFNLLAQGNSSAAVDELCQLFEYLYPDMRRGIWSRAALHRGLMTLITRQGSSFVDLVPLLSPSARTEAEQQWRDELIGEVDDPELAKFWERFDDLSVHQQENYAAPLLDRVWQLNGRPEIRDIIGQSTSSFQLSEAIRSRKVVLVNLSGLGVETARLAGTLFLNAIWSAVRSGACDPANPTLLCLDEFQDFLNLPVDAESMLVQARSFGLAMVLAHQHLDQLTERVRPAVMANARSKVVFQTTYDDVRVFARVRQIREP